MQRIQSKLSSRITFLVALVLIIVFGIQTFLITNYLTSISKDNVESEIELRAESISKDVRKIFEDANLVTNQMALNREITRYLKEVNERSDIKTHPLFSHVKNTLLDIKKTSSNYFIVWIANGSANFYLDHTGYISDASYDVLKRPWYEPASESEGIVFTEPYIEWESGKNVLSSILALREGDKIYGFVVVDISLDSIPTIFKSIELKGRDKYFLISEDGKYVYHPNQTLALESDLSLETDPLHLYKDFILSESKTIKDIVFEGRHMLLTSHEVGVSGWKIVTLLDMEPLNKNTAKQGIWIGLTFLTAIFLAIVLISRMVTQSTKPFRVLTEYGVEIADGDLTRNIPTIYRNRQDEMGDLAVSFQTIIETFVVKRHTEEKSRKE